MRVPPSPAHIAAQVQQAQRPQATPRPVAAADLTDLTKPAAAPRKPPAQQAAAAPATNRAEMRYERPGSRLDIKV